MILLADSGATKTSWALLEVGEITRFFTTTGQNPVHNEQVSSAEVLISQLPDYINRNSQFKIYYYCAGCFDDIRKKQTTDFLEMVFPFATINTDSDMMAACLALYGNNKQGIACILGTGANACYYNGKEITMNIKPLGYILGDEGSGAYIGKLFLNKLFRNEFSSAILDYYKVKSELEYSQVLDRVYKKPEANKFLASLLPAILEMQNETEIQDLLIQAVSDFFHRFIFSVPHYKNSLLGFCGSTAFLLQKYIQEFCLHNKLQEPKILRYPIEGLSMYFKQ